MEDGFRERVMLAAAGGAHGLAIWLLVDAWPDSHTARAIAVTLLTFLAVTAVVFHFAWTAEHRRRLIALTLGTGFVYAAVAGWVGASLPTPELISQSDEDRAATWVAASLLTLYVLGPFLQSFQRNGKAHFPYRDLFLHGWNNFFVALVGGLFVGALWTVLMLWAALFELVGVEVFEDLFTEGFFVSPVTGAAAGFGIALGRESERVVSTLRGITLAVFRGLLPLVAFVALIFLGTLPFTGLDGLWDTNHASQLLVTWVALTILFLNAVYQDGAGDDLPPGWVRRGVEGALLAMAVYVGIAAYGISMRIGQYGLTPERFWGVLATAILGAYAFGYALAVLRRGEPWLRMVRAVNLVVALLVAAIGLLAHTPVLDPIGWSARSQFKRLAEGRISAAEFDYGYLQFELGRAGLARLAELETLEAHPERSIIQEQVVLVRAEENYWRWKQHHGSGFGPDSFEVLPAGATLPEGLIEFARRENLVWTDEACGAKRYCAAIQVELDGEAPKEWVLVVHRQSWSQALAIAETDTGFRPLGVLQPMEGGAKPAELEASLKAADFGTEAPRFRDFRIGEARYRVVPN